MLEKITYKNHLNELVDFGENGLFLNNNDLRSYTWNYTANNNKIAYFSRDIQEKTLPVIVCCGSRDEGYSIVNRLMEVADKDVMTSQPGKIEANGYYLTCYLFESIKGSYDLDKGLFYADLKVVTDSPAWIKETNSSFNPSSGGSGQNLDYPFDFPYDFASPSASNTLVNYGFADTDFKLIIYGEVTDPSVTIAGHIYSVTGHVDADEYLIIDSRTKTITKVEGDGDQVNWFQYRNKLNYVFQKIPSGENNVLWDGTFSFNVTLYEERSEPKWI